MAAVSLNAPLPCPLCRKAPTVSRIRFCSCDDRDCDMYLLHLVPIEVWNKLAALVEPDADAVAKVDAFADAAQAYALMQHGVGHSKHTKALMDERRTAVLRRMLPRVTEETTKEMNRIGAEVAELARATHRPPEKPRVDFKRFWDALTSDERFMREVTAQLYRDALRASGCEVEG